MLSNQSIDRRWLVRNYGENKALLVSDLHLGFDVEWHGRGLWTKKPIWSFEILQNLRKDILKTTPSHLIICGDLEHHFRIRRIRDGQDSFIILPEEVRNSILHEFKSQILGIPDLKVILIQGENDVSLYKELEDYCQIVPSEGKSFFDNQLGIFHGQISPYKEIVFASEIILGHLHPEVELKDDLQIRHKFPVFLHLQIPREDLFPIFHFPFELDEIGMVDMVSITILPTYNHFLSGYVMNMLGGGKRRHKPYPILRSILHHPNAQVKMTDGIDLGNLMDI
jgi:metallophosphoesterase superfamily enzyme